MISPLVRRIVGISVLLGVTAACLPYLTSGRSPSETANNLGISISQTTDKRKTFADRSTVRLQGQRERPATPCLRLRIRSRLTSGSLTGRRPVLMTERRAGRRR